MGTCLPGYLCTCVLVYMGTCVLTIHAGHTLSGNSKKCKHIPKVEYKQMCSALKMLFKCDDWSTLCDDWSTLCDDWSTLCDDWSTLCDDWSTSMKMLFKCDDWSTLHRFLAPDCRGGRHPNRSRRAHLVSQLPAHFTAIIRPQ